jgi:hypothetical protein
MSHQDAIRLSAKQMFNDFNKDNNIDFLAVQRQINQFVISKEDKITKSNICSIDPQYKRKFNIPESELFTLFQNLLKCFNNGIITHLNERQISNDDDFSEGSGMMLDLDIFTESEIDALDEINILDFIVIIYKTYQEVLDLPNEVYDCNQYIAIIKKSVPIFKENEGKYKHGIHILLPCIKMAKTVKKFIFNKLINNEEAQDMFAAGTFKLDLKEILDKNSVSVPVHFIGSCKPESIPYVIHSIYKLKISPSRIFSPIAIENNKFENVIYEFSLNYEMPNGLVKKILCMPKSNIFSSIRHYSTNNGLFDADLENAENDINLKSINNPEIEELKHFLSLLSIDRIKNYVSWRDIIFALSSGGEDLKSLGIWVSKRTPDKFDMFKFEELWSEARKYKGANKLTVKSIKYWAKMDAPDLYEKFEIDTVYKMIRTDAKAKSLAGNLYHSQFAKYIHFVFSNKLIAIDAQSKTVEWWEFVTEYDKDIMPGQLYKWKLIGSTPDSLIIYLKEDLPIVFNRILTEMDHSINCEEDSDRKKMLEKLRNNFKHSMNQLYNEAFKKSVIAESVTDFKQNSFYYTLDTIPEIMGVGNGVLKFSGPDVTLIDTYHSYPISLYTSTDYVAYDENNKYVKQVYGILSSMFLEEEYDAFEFLMYYLSTTLDGFPKDSLILILTGVGCHGIDTSIRMFDNTIKLVQDIQKGDIVMGDDQTPRLVEQLFTGIEQMVLIEPEDHESFKVNINHVMSLKFVNVINIEKIKNKFFDDDEYLLSWFEYNDTNEPKYKSRTCSSFDVAKFTIERLQQSKSVVNECDIIDIRLSQFLKWNKWWKDHVMMYKFDTKKLYYFNSYIINNDRFYGFEVNGNHRYLTGDGFIHHNSNGKSFLLEFIKATLGELYVRKLPISFLTEQARAKSQTADPAMMELKYARMAFYSESSQNEKLNVSRMKEITGQETLSSRQLFKGQENFKPNCNHMVTTNNRFAIDSTDHAVWRRILTYMFKMVFMPESKITGESKFERIGDPDVIRKCLTDKRLQEAFLSILVHYRCKLYAQYDGKLSNVPNRTIEKETLEYRNREDIFNRFLDQKCYYCKGVDQPMDEILSIFRAYFKMQNNEHHKANNDDLKSIFMNSKITKYFRTENGITKLYDLKIVEEGYSPKLDETLYVEYVANNKN